jgi:TIR domain
VTGGDASAGHVFISYVRENSREVGRLQQTLLSKDIRVWRDTDDLWPGQDWRAEIRQAIISNALVFIACFSSDSNAREVSYQNEELVLAIEQLRLRPPDEPWLIPIRFDDCDIPDRDIGAGRTLASIQRADLFGDNYDKNVDRLVTVVRRILKQHGAGQHSVRSGPITDKDSTRTRLKTTPRASKRASQGKGDNASHNRGRVGQDVTDISAVSQLISFAAAGQLALLNHRPDLSQAKIAYGAGLGPNVRNAGAALSRALNLGFTTRQLQGLDEIIGTLALESDSTGSLSSLALRLSTERSGKIERVLTAAVPPNWTSKVLSDPVTDESGVIIQASALLSAFATADRMSTSDRDIDSIRNRYQYEIQLLTRRLLVIATGPPTARNYDARVMLGHLASYAFELMRPHLDHELRNSPLRFRVWSAITSLVTIGPAMRDTAGLVLWLRQIMRDAEDLRKSSLYPGSSLDLELAISVPAVWSPPHDDWASAALLSRVRNSNATMEERGTAAMGLWQRAIRDERPDLENIARELRQLIRELRNPETRPDVRVGLRWIAATLELVIDRRVSVCNEWPDIDEPWLQHAKEAANELDGLGLPAQLLSGAKSLFYHMVVQNAGVYRDRAIDTVVTSGWTGPVARALSFLLSLEKGESWLRVRALYALGHLQRRDREAEANLITACRNARRNLGPALDADVPPLRSHVSEMHASLFAVGDCFGVVGAEKRAKSAREELRAVLIELAGLEDDSALMLRRAATAAAYLLTVTAQPREGMQRDLSQELLEQLSRHPDPVTSRLSAWALSFRFAPDGTVRPLLAAAEHEVPAGTTL